MRNGTRNRLAVAVLVLALGSSELAAYQGVAPYAKTLLSSGQSQAVRKASALVARQLSALALRSAGYRVRNYAGSWHEWSRHDELPLERD